MNNERIERARAMFSTLDITGTGKLSRQTVSTILSSEGDQLDKLLTILLFEKFDFNGDNLIEFEEFVAFLESIENLSDVEILRQIFEISDVDHNETLDVDEVKRIGQMMGMDVTTSDSWQTIIALDRNNDNAIDFPEFCQILTPYN